MVATPIGIETLASMLPGALARHLGTAPTRAMASLFMALLWNETGRGKSSQQHSLGNILAAYIKNGVEHFTWDGDYWRPPWFEDESRTNHALMLEGRAPSAFRAYPSHEAALDDFARLVSGSRYAPLREAAMTGDASAFVRAMASTGYDTSTSPATIRGLVKEFGEKGLFAGLSSEVRGGAGGAGGALLLLGAGFAGWMFFRRKRS